MRLTSFNKATVYIKSYVRTKGKMPTELEVSLQLSKCHSDLKSAYKKQI